MGPPASGDAAAQLKVGGPGGGPIGGGGCSGGSGTANSLPRLALWLIGLRKDGARVVDSIISSTTGTSSPSRFRAHLRELTEVDRIDSNVKATVAPEVNAMIVRAGCRLQFPLDSSDRVARPRVGRLQRTPAQRPARAL